MRNRHSAACSLCPRAVRVALCVATVALSCARAVRAEEFASGKGVVVSPVAPVPPVAPAPTDPQGRMRYSALDALARKVFRELLAGMPASDRKRMPRTELRIEVAPTGIMATARCTGIRRALIQLDSGLLVLFAGFAETAAQLALHPNDEASQNAAAAFLRYARAAMYAQARTPRSDLAAIPQSQRVAESKRRLQTHLFEEVVAFMIAHEIGHVTTNLAWCEPVVPGDSGAFRALMRQSEPPSAQQPIEYEADAAGMRLVLAARRGDRTVRFSRAGGLGLMTLYAAFEHPTELYDPSRTHPHALLRRQRLGKLAQPGRSAGEILPLSIGIPTADSLPTPSGRATTGR